MDSMHSGEQNGNAKRENPAEIRLRLAKAKLKWAREHPDEPGVEQRIERYTREVEHEAKMVAELNAKPAARESRSHGATVVRLATTATTAGPPTATVVRNTLDAKTWMSLDIAPPDRLLGDFVTTTTRAFLVGRTGLGKTMVGLGLATAMATGKPFLNWTPERIAKVLYIDGEMSTRLIKKRLVDAQRRCGTEIPAGNLFVYSADRADTLSGWAPMPALNTDEGQNWVLEMTAALGGVDCIIFDNVMSLLTGDQKDEETWSKTLPFVSKLTSRKIGQIWLDHTGHNADRIYGSNTKLWRFDVAAVMKPVADQPADGRELVFELNFDAKAREREPSNWKQFENCIVRLKDDVWSTEPVAASAKVKAPSPMQTVVAHAARLIAASGGQSVSKAEIQEACVADDILSMGRTDSRTRVFRRAYQDAFIAKRLRSEGEQVFLVPVRPESGLAQPKFPAFPPDDSGIPT